MFSPIYKLNEKKHTHLGQCICTWLTRKSKRTLN